MARRRFQHQSDRHQYSLGCSNRQSSNQPRRSERSVYNTVSMLLKTQGRKDSPPVFKVGEARVRKTVLASIPVDLAVVEEISDDGRDIVSLDTSSNVLTIATTTDLGVVAVVAGLGPVLRSLDESQIPGSGRGGVVAAVDIVVVEGNVGVAGQAASGSGGGNG